MTIATLQTKTIALGNNFATQFGFNFAVRSVADIQVTYQDAAGNQTNVTGNCVIALNAVAPAAQWSIGGTVTYAPNGVPIALGTELIITRIVPLTQGTVFANQGGNYPAITEQGLDIVTMMMQQMQELLSRAITLNVADVNVSPQLPIAAARAGGTLGFDQAGNPVVVSAGGVPVFPQVPSVVDTIAAMKALAIPTSAITILVRGYLAVGDGGGGFYWWNAADNTADNGGTVIQPNGGAGGRYNKLFQGAIA